MSQYAKALSNVSQFEKRWFLNRINRKLDDRDFVLAEALKNVEGASSSLYPEVQVLSAGLLAPSLLAGALTGETIDGVNLMGDSTQSVGATALSTGKITLEAVLPGAQTLVFVNDITGGVPPAVITVLGNTITATHDGTDTAGAIAALINADPVAMYMVNAVATTPGAMDAAETVSIEGGEGDLMEYVIGGNPMDGTNLGCGVTDVSGTQIVVDIDPTALGGGLTAGVGYAQVLRADGYLVKLPYLVPGV
jgi:hypothetical protein